MVIKNLQIVLLITAAQLLLSSSCNKNGTRPCLNGGYSFAVTSEWSPESGIYYTGDTITLISTFSKTLTNQINPTLQIDYSNSVGIGGNLTIYALDTINHNVIGAIDKFHYIEVIGDLTDGTIAPLEVKDTHYTELSTSYTLTLKVIAMQKGIFIFYISNLGSNGLRGKDCTNAGFTNIVTNTERGLSLFEYALGRPPASQYEIDRMYCFRVQ